jgi:predicted nucleotidyltransferase
LKIAGIVAEYNPFHTGHLIHIESTRQAVGEDAGIVCVMSGNFVQRGEPTVYGKHARALAAVLSGADLVLELPVPYVLSSAEGFAFGAVSLLDSLKCIDYISFGSESGNVSQLRKTAELLLEPAMDSILREELSRGVSYAAARHLAAEKLSERKLDILKTPNNILGIEYIKAIIRLESTIQPLTFKRVGAGHDKKEAVNGIASASMLRKRLREGLDINGYIPEAAALVFHEEEACGRAPIFLEALETAVLSRLRSMSKEEYEALPDASEGLGLRLMKHARKEATLGSILKKVKTKRYAYTRIRRMVICAYLGIDIKARPKRPPYARVLASNMKGRGILKQIQKNMPVITKPTEAKKLPAEAARLFELEASTTDKYVLAYPEVSKRVGGQEWIMSPKIV